MEAIGIISGEHGMKSQLGGLAPVIKRPWARQAPSLGHQALTHIYCRAIQQVIKAQGTKGVMFLEKTEEALNKELPKLIDKAKQKAEKAWGAN
jgi:hypothetical protein